MSAEELVADGAMTVAEAVKFSGIGRTRLYTLMGANELAYTVSGDRRLIPRRALTAYLAKQLRGGPPTPDRSKSV